MAITRRQFVTRMGALAATVGMSQSAIAQISEAFAGNSHALGGTFGKPRVIWIHGAECTGCSTSLLGILEDPAGKIYGTENILHAAAIGTGEALGAAGVTAYDGVSAFPSLAGGTRTALYGGISSSIDEASEHVNIADVVIDVIDLQYHETIMGMGGDLAAQWLKDFVDYTPGAGTNPGDAPFVLVVEGALQDKDGGGAWGDTHTEVPWCSIGTSDNFEGATGFEHDMATTVRKLAIKSTCAAIIPIGQCASYGGYPGAKPQISATTANKAGDGFDPTKSQTGAKGVYQYLTEYAGADAALIASSHAADKVINVPGCPTNPWWFVLTVAMFMVDLVNPSHPLGVLGAGGLPAASAIDYGRRLKAVYPIPVHSAYCPRYPSYNKGIFAARPGDAGCLQKLGCKGIATNSLCGVHGWNNAQPQNAGSQSAGDASINKGRGGHCTTAGHPCMACTEKGYPDSFVPFVKR
jgi:Ni,Fe-hydrogenase I small subunit